MPGLPMIPVTSLHPHEGNVRGNLGDVTELAASIRARGLLQPLVVIRTGAGWTVIDGHRRLAAAKLAGAKALPCIEIKTGSVGEQLATMLASAMHKGLDPIDQARAFTRLRARGLTIATIAQMTGYTPDTIYSRLLLISLPEEVQDLVAAKKLTVTDATAMAREVKAAGHGSAYRHDPKAAWLVRTHPLATSAAARCNHAPTRVLVGAVACGQCWESAIRHSEHVQPNVGSAS